MSDIDRTLRAAGDGDLGALAELLTGDPSLANATGANPYWGGTVQPLHLAVTWGQDAAVRLLLDRGADPAGDNEGYGGWSPLLVAATRSLGTIADALESAGAPVYLFEAAALGRSSRVLAALAEDPDRAADRLPDATSLLHLARTADLVRALLAGGADLEACDAYGARPLDSALGRAARGDEDDAEVARALIEAGAAADAAVWAALGDDGALDATLRSDPAALDRPGLAGRPPLHAAVRHGRLRTVERLIDRGADVNLADASGIRPLHWTASAPGDAIGVARALLDAGADPTRLDAIHEATPADWADFQRRPELERVLAG